MTATLRSLWLTAHRWLGLTAGLIFCLLGLTGSLLVFDHAIDEWLNPQLLLSEGSGTPAKLHDVIEAAEQSFGGPALSVQSPRVADGVWTVWFQSGSEREPRFTQVLVDPYTAEVTGQRVWGEYLMTIIYRLHFRLLAGATGATVVGVIGMLVLVSLVSGIVLWWPLWRHSLRAAFAVRRGKQLYDLHKSAGIVSSLVLGVVAFTGVYMEFPEWFHAALAPVSTVTAPPDDLKSNPGREAPPLTADEAIAAARSHFPGAPFEHLHPPVGADGFYEVAFRQEGEVQRSFGRTQVFLDQYDGSVLSIRTPDDFTAADTFVAWQFPLHNGEAFGLLGRWIVFASGIVPAVLYVSGLALWWRRTRKRAALRERQRRTVLAAPPVAIGNPSGVAAESSDASAEEPSVETSVS